MFIAISAARGFRTDDAGQDLEADQQRAWPPSTSPTRPPRSATVVHRIAMHRSRPSVAVHAETLGRHAATTRATTGGRSAANLPTDFGFVIDQFTPMSRRPFTWFRSKVTRSIFLDGKLRCTQSDRRQSKWEPLNRGLPQQDCYVNVVRDAMAVDSARPVWHLLRQHRAGTESTRQPMPATNWAPLVHDLPGVLSVELQTLP